MEGWVYRRKQFQVEYSNIIIYIYISIYIFTL